MRLGLGAIIVAGLTSAAMAQDKPLSPAPQTLPAPIPVAYPPPPAPPPKGRSRVSTPLGNPATWVSVKDYPPEAKQNHISGTVGFRLTIGTGGLVQDCVITASSGFESLDRGTCEVLRRNGRFRPALDPQGKPTLGSWSSRVHWIAPDDGPPLKLDELTTVLTFVVEADGTASNCSATRNGVAVTEVKVATPCSTGERFEPFKGPSGKPTRKKVTVTRSVRVADPD